MVSIMFNLKKEMKKLRDEYQINYQMYDYDFDEEIVKEYHVGDKLPVIIYGDKRLIGEKSYDEIVVFLKECDLIWKQLRK